MTRLTLLLSVLVTLPPAKPLDENYVAVRKDVFRKLEAADANLPVCEQALEDAQNQLQTAQANINELKAAADELQRQKELLDKHIASLETIIIRYQDYTRLVDENAFVAGWEEVDGVVGIGAGYVIGTAQCIGIAWVFNQPAFRR